MKRGKIGPRLLLIANRKLHTRFRLVPKSTTLDDLVGPLRISLKTRASFGAHRENLNEDRPILSATKMYPMTLLSDNIRFMRMLAVILEIYVNFP